MSNNDTPGVNMEEASMVTEPIEGVGTSTVAFVGGAPQGPVLEPTLVTTWDQFEEVFGVLDFAGKGFLLPHAVTLFFTNGGQRAYIVRVTEDSAKGRNGVAYRNGLTCLEALNDINLVAMPDTTDILDQQELIRHCEKIQYRFAIIDSPSDPREVGDAHDVRLQRLKLMSVKGYAAIYYPWLQIQDPRTKRIRVVPPCGAVAGIYARSDLQKGVNKAPANEPVLGVLETEVAVDQADQQELDRIQVNVIRKFSGRGILVWGAKTISNDPILKYISVRRTAIYLEKSIFDGTQWITFEPNDETTWALIRQPILEFLQKEWKDGKLVGPKAQDAYFVRCDRTTMTQADIDNGTLIVEVGVALIRPAEFVILRIAHQMERVGPRNLVDKTLDGTKKKKHYYMARTMKE